MNRDDKIDALELSLDRLSSLVLNMNATMTAFTASVDATTQASSFTTTVSVIDDSTVSVVSTLDCGSDNNAPCGTTDSTTESASTTNAVDGTTPLHDTSINLMETTQTTASDGTVAGAGTTGFLVTSDANATVGVTDSTVNGELHQIVSSGQ